VKSVFAWLAVLALALTVATNGCSKRVDPLAEQEASEAAANVGQAPAAQTSEAGRDACTRAVGEWEPGQQHCRLTPAICAATSGTWQAGTGCVVEVANEVECSGFRGMQWKSGVCSITYLSSDELSQAGY